MIPEFNDHGFLPPGIHPAGLDEIEARFGRQSELRRVQMQSLGWLVDIAQRAGIARIIINGSFVTDVLEPNDADCVLLIGPDYPREAAAEAELSAGLPFLEVQIVEEEGFEYLVGRFFATDQDSNPKGMIEVML
jgi:hypothetical protein